MMSRCRSSNGNSGLCRAVVGVRLFRLSPSTSQFCIRLIEISFAPSSVFRHFGRLEERESVIVNRVADDEALATIGQFTNQALNLFDAVQFSTHGHGLTDAVPAPYSAKDLADDVARLLDALEIGEAVIGGVSVGGIIAQALALNHPRRVRALALCDTGARIGSVESWQQRIGTVQTGGLKALESPTMERWFSAQFRARRPADIRGYSTMLLQTSVAGYIGTCCALRDADFPHTPRRL